jgi:hypothetical protein
MKYLFGLTVLLLPTYVLKFSLFGFSTNVLMVWIFGLWVMFGLWLFYRKEWFEFARYKIEMDFRFKILLGLFLLAGTLSLFVGDVGSGKTFIAATIAYAVIKNRPTGQNFGNLQVAYMAPTEVLATQLYESFIEYFDHTGISIGLITGSGCRKFPSKSAHWENGAQVRTWTPISRNQLLKWVKNGEIPIVIGTHALISKSVEFQDLGLVIIDVTPR